MAVGKAKLDGRAFYDSIGSPKYVVAPMVDQSELAWRILSRMYGAQLCYTPMFHAALMSNDESQNYIKSHFDTSPESLEGKAPFDRPLVVQFCANDKDQWLKAALKIADRCDAVDLNLGCPQGIAKRGRYGAFLMEERQLIRDMISHMHKHLPIPVIAKIRVYPDLERTLEYAKHVVDSGAQLLTVHGRTREAKGQLAGFASWSKIKSVCDMIKSYLPIFANGGIPAARDVEPCLEQTRVDGVMSAEGNLYNPMIFAPSNAAEGRTYFDQLPEDMKAAIRECDTMLEGEWDKDQAAYAPATYLASQYLAIVRTLPSTETAGTAIKAHIFKLFRPIFAADKHLDLRESLSRIPLRPGMPRSEKIDGFVRLVNEMHSRLQQDLAQGLLPANSYRPLTHDQVENEFGGVIPYSHAQPYYRVIEDTSTKRPAEESQDVAKKKARVDEVGTSDSEKGAAGPLLGGPCVDPECINNAAARCALGACSTCCTKLTKDDPTKRCEFHELKAQKAQERQNVKKLNRLAKKKALLEKRKRDSLTVTTSQPITS